MSLGARMQRVVVADEPALGEELRGAGPDGRVVVQVAHPGDEDEVVGRVWAAGLWVAEDEVGRSGADAGGDLEGRGLAKGRRSYGLHLKRTVGASTLGSLTRSETQSLFDGGRGVGQ